MSDPFIGGVCLFAAPFGPRGRAGCDGALWPIPKSEALFSLLRVTFGGDGRTPFALPDLRGRSPVHRGQRRGLTARERGDSGGTAAFARTAAQSPHHAQALSTTPPPANAGPAAGAPARAEDAPTVAMADVAIAEAGAGAAHENRQPFLVIAFHIAVQGVFPS